MSAWRKVSFSLALAALLTLAAGVMLKVFLSHSLATALVYAVIALLWLAAGFERAGAWKAKRRV